MRFLALYLAVTLVSALPATGDARGTVRVQQPSGAVQTYSNVTFAVIGNTLHITTADGNGTLIVTDSACSLVDALLQCLPYRVVLVQNGSHLLDIERGTIYYNPTGTTQTLKYSSTRIPAGGILGTMKSNIGTYVNLSGKLDSRSK
jgi:hypothetical protein